MRKFWPNRLFGEIPLWLKIHFSTAGVCGMKFISFCGMNLNEYFKCIHRRGAKNAEKNQNQPVPKLGNRPKNSG